MGAPDAGADARTARAVTIAIVLVIVAANLACKLPGLGGQSLWLDEALTAAVAARPVGEIVARATANQNPPLYGILMHGWTGVFGASEASLRAFPALCSVATAVALFLLAHRHLGFRAAVLAAVLFTGSNVHVQYAREARVYALVSSLTVASTWVFLGLVRRPGPRAAATLGFVNALLFYCHYVTALVPLAQLVAVVTHPPWRRRAARGVSASVAVTAMLVLPWMQHALRNAPRAGDYWLAAPTFKDLRDVLMRFAAERRQLYFALLLFLAPLRRALGVSETSGDRGVARYLAIAAFLPIAVAFVVSTWVPIFLDRYLLFASIAVVLLLAHLLALLPMSGRGFAVLTVAVAAFVAPRALRERDKDDWRGLVAAARARHESLPPGASLVLVSAGELPAFVYYFDRAALGADDPGGTARAHGILGVDDADDVAADVLARARSIAVVRTRLGAPDVAALLASDFDPPRSAARVTGLELLAHERAR